MLKVLRKLKYKNCPVYIRQLNDSMFEYLLIYQKHIYNNYFIFKPAWYRRFSKNKYTEAEIQNIIQFIWGGAKYTIDELKKKT